MEGARASPKPASGQKRLPVDFLIANRANPRRDFDADQLDELTNSIREKGVMQPLLVRPSDGPESCSRSSPASAAGARRSAPGLHDVPVIVREVDDKEALELAIIENVQRVDLNPLEEAMGYDQLIEQFSYTQQRPCAGHRQVALARRQHAAAAEAAARMCATCWRAAS